MKYQELHNNLLRETNSILQELGHKLLYNAASKLSVKVIEMESMKFFKSKLRIFQNENLVVKKVLSCIGYSYTENTKSYVNIFTDSVYNLVDEIDVIEVSYENLQDSFRTSILTGLYNHFSNFKGLSPENRYLVLYLLENNLLNE